MRRWLRDTTTTGTSRALTDTPATSSSQRLAGWSTGTSGNAGFEEIHRAFPHGDRPASRWTLPEGCWHTIGGRSSRRREVSAPHEAEHPFLDRLGPGARIT